MYQHIPIYRLLKYETLQSVKNTVVRDKLKNIEYLTKLLNF